MSADGGGLLTDVVTVNTILHTHAAVLGQDFAGYRNHVYRVLNLCRYIAGGSRVEVDTLAVAAAFHDLGIWTHGTFDYIGPSAELARTYLLSHARPKPPLTALRSRFAAPTGSTSRVDSGRSGCQGHSSARSSPPGRVRAFTVGWSSSACTG